MRIRKKIGYAMGLLVACGLALGANSVKGQAEETKPAFQGVFPQSEAFNVSKDCYVALEKKDGAVTVSDFFWVKKKSGGSNFSIKDCSYSSMPSSGDTYIYLCSKEAYQEAADKHAKTIDAGKCTKEKICANKDKYSVVLNYSAYDKSDKIFKKICVGTGKNAKELSEKDGTLYFKAGERGIWKEYAWQDAGDGNVFYDGAGFLQSCAKTGAVMYYYFVPAGTESEPYIHSSKMSKIKIAKEAKAPSVKIDTKNATIGLKSGMSYNRNGDFENWMDVAEKDANNKKVSAVSAYTVTNTATGSAIASGTSIYYRMKGTEKKPASQIGMITLASANGLQKVSLTADLTDDEKTVASKGGITFHAEEGAAKNGYEYMVVKAEEVTNYFGNSATKDITNKKVCKWSALKDFSKKVTYKSAKIPTTAKPEEYVILLREKGYVEKTTKKSYLPGRIYRLALSTRKEQKVDGVSVANDGILSEDAAKKTYGEASHGKNISLKISEMWLDDETFYVNRDCYFALEKKEGAVPVSDFHDIQGYHVNTESRMEVVSFASLPSNKEGYIYLCENEDYLQAIKTGAKTVDEGKCVKYTIKENKDKYNLQLNYESFCDEDSMVKKITKENGSSSQEVSLRDGELWIRDDARGFFESFVDIKGNALYKVDYLKKLIQTGCTLSYMYVPNTNRQNEDRIFIRAKVGKIKIPKEAKAPTVKQNVKNGTIGLKTGMCYSLTGRDDDWTMVPDKGADGKKITSMSIYEVTKTATGSAIASGTAVYYRTMGTAKKPASKIGRVVLRAAEGLKQVSIVADLAADQKTVASKGGITFKAEEGGSSSGYEYMAVKAGEVSKYIGEDATENITDTKKCKWINLKDFSKKVTYKSAKIPVTAKPGEYIILLREKGYTDKTSKIEYMPGKVFQLTV